MPTDADFVLLTHGHFDHITSAYPLVMASTKPNVKLISIGEVHYFFEHKHKMPIEKMHRMNKNGKLDYEFGTIQMVAADHSSSCGVHDGILWDGGAAAGFVLTFKEDGKVVYHSGDTGVFGDM